MLFRSAFADVNLHPPLATLTNRPVRKLTVVAREARPFFSHSVTLLPAHSLN